MAGYSGRYGVQFFYDNGGSSYDPATETPEQGRKRSADRLAAAYKALKESDCFIKWEPEDLDPADSFDTSIPELAETVESIRNGDTKWLWCGLYDADGNLLASMGGIAVDSLDAPYCRVVEAELAIEAELLQA